MIYDRTGMSRANQDMQVIKFTTSFVSMLQDYYAERLAKFYVVGANWLYKMLYAVIKPFLSKKTKEKVHSIYLSSI